MTLFRIPCLAKIDLRAVTSCAQSVWARQSEETWGGSTHNIHLACSGAGWCPLLPMLCLECYGRLVVLWCYYTWTCYRLHTNTSSIFFAIPGQCVTSPTLSCYISQCLNKIHELSSMSALKLWGTSHELLKSRTSEQTSSSLKVQYFLISAGTCLISAGHPDWTTFMTICNSSAVLNALFLRSAYLLIRHVPATHLPTVALNALWGRCVYNEQLFARFIADL